MATATQEVKRYSGFAFEVSGTANVPVTQQVIERQVVQRFQPMPIRQPAQAQPQQQQQQRTNWLIVIGAFFLGYIIGRG